MNNMISKKFDDSLIEAKIKSIVSGSKHIDDEDNYIELSSYFRRMAATGFHTSNAF